MLEKLRQRLTSFQLLDIPLGAYVVNAEGTIVACNETMRAMLFNDPVGEPENSLFEEVARARRSLPSPHTDAVGLRNELRVRQRKDHDLVVTAFSERLVDPKGKTIGHLRCLVDVTEEHTLRRLFEHFPAGIYRLDRNDRLIAGNPALAKLFGYASFGEMAGIRAEDVFRRADEARELREKINREGDVVDFRAELVRKGGQEKFFASITASAVLDRASYQGREGTIVDVTREEQYRQLIEEMPVGLYRVTTAAEGELIDDCNRPFAQIAGYDQPADVIGRLMREFHVSDESYRSLLQRLKDGHGELRTRVEIKRRDGEKRLVEVTTRRLPERGLAEGTSSIRVGAVQDVSERHELEERIGELTRDIGNTLHTYTSALVSLEQGIRPALQTLGPDPFGENVLLGHVEPLLENFEPSRRDLIASIATLLEEGNAEERRGGLSEENWARLERYREALSHARLAAVHPEARHAVLRRLALGVLEVLHTVIPGHLPKERVRDARRTAQEMARLGTILALRLSHALVLDMGFQLRALREFVTLERRADELPARLSVLRLVRVVFSEHAEYAQSRGVELRGTDLCGPEIEVRGVERDLLRALGNLVHNAIKYSWSRPEGGVWVGVGTRQENCHICIEVRNYGVPIPEDEKPLIFALGFRGRLSSERRRTGTGIGLADALRVAHKHKGTLLAESRPASPSSSPDDYSKPFLTTFTLKLPLISGED